MSSGETLDPRIIKATLNNCPAITQSCVIGNNFLSGTAQVVCAIIEPTMTKDEHPLTSDITRAIATVNRTLSPPLRIAWSRVLVLANRETIPITKKRTIFRKKLEEVFGERMRALSIRPDVLQRRRPLFFL